MRNISKSSEISKICITNEKSKIRKSSEIIKISKTIDISKISKIYAMRGRNLTSEIRK